MRVEDLGLESSDLTVSNFYTRAYRSLQRKVKRAFSFHRTPTRVHLKRAMISPLSNNSNANIANSSTPSSGIQNRRNSLESLKSSRS
jgi:hypothetical protein